MCNRKNEKWKCSIKRKLHCCFGSLDHVWKERLWCLAKNRNKRSQPPSFSTCSLLISMSLLIVITISVVVIDTCAMCIKILGSSQGRKGAALSQFQRWNWLQWWMQVGMHIDRDAKSLSRRAETCTRFSGGNLHKKIVQQCTCSFWFVCTRRNYGGMLLDALPV